MKMLSYRSSKKYPAACGGDFYWHHILKTLPLLRYVSWKDKKAVVANLK
jgi:hypothetical protein